MILNDINDKYKLLGKDNFKRLAYGKGHII